MLYFQKKERRIRYFGSGYSNDQISGIWFLPEVGVGDEVGEKKKPHLSVYYYYLILSLAILLFTESIF